MDYDEIAKHSQMGPEIQEKFFWDYIAPLLKDPKNTPRIEYFFQQGYNAWRLDVRGDDLKQVKFIEWICEELKKINETELLEVLSSILSQHYEVGIRTEQAERNAHNSQIKGNKIGFFSDQIRLYKTFFENEFRLNATIPYLYACRVYGKKNKVTNVFDFVNVGGGEKYHTLKDVQTPLPKGNFQKLIIGFNNQIRNAGEGHDRWEVTDKDTLMLPIIDPVTGSEKNKIELTDKALKDLIKQCRKTVWILKMGYLVFLENNKEFAKKIKEKSVVKLREIEDSVREFADNRWFDIKSFSATEDKSKLSLSIKYAPKIVGTKGQIFFGNGEAYDLVEKETFVSYEYQMLDILHSIVGYFDSNEIPRILVDMYDEDDSSLGTVEYEPSELSKLLKEEGEVEIPKPSSGDVPDKTCRIVVLLKVPYGQRAIWEKIIKEKK